MWHAFLLIIGQLVPCFTPTTAAPQLSLVPWPTNLTLLQGGSVVALSSATRVVYAAENLSTAALLLQSEMSVLHNLQVTPVAGTAARPGDILLKLVPVPPPSPLPPPPPAPAPALPVVCNATAGSLFNNTAWANLDGPVTAADAGECCQTCAKTSGCKHWSFQIDPKVAGKRCGWSHLTYWYVRDPLRTTLDAMVVCGMGERESERET